MQYDLITEPWIPVGPSGTRLGLSEIFVQANAIPYLAGPPLVQAALYRLLIAITAQACGVPDPGTWRAWLSTGLPSAKITAYLARHRQRFDLAHPQYPFAQATRSQFAAYDAQYPNGEHEPKYICALCNVQEHNSILYTKQVPIISDAMSAADVACNLLAHLNFVPAGGRGRAGKYLKSASYSTGTCSMLLGDNLAQSIALGMPPDTICGQPFWETRTGDDFEIFSDKPIIPDGICAWYTHPSRMVHVLWDGDASRQMYYTMGRELAPDAVDPMALLGANKNRMMFDACVEPCQFVASALQKYDFVMKMLDKATARLYIACYGMQIEKAKIEAANMCCISLGRHVVANTDARQTCIAGLQMAEGMGRTLRQLPNREKYHETGGVRTQPTPQQQAEARDLERQYWFALSNKADWYVNCGLSETEWASAIRDATQTAIDWYEQSKSQKIYTASIREHTRAQAGRRLPNERIG